MPRKINQKKITTENVKESSVKDSLEICEKNISELFRRTTVSKWAKSESVTFTSASNNNRQNPPGLEVAIDGSDKPDSIRVFLRQKSEASSATTTTGGGLWLRSVPPGGPLGFATIAMRRNGVVCHSTVIGSGLVATALAGFAEWNHFYPPNVLDFMDLDPIVGVATYTVEMALQTNPATGLTLAFVDVELVAQKFY